MRSRPQPRLGVTAPLPLPPSAPSPVLRDTKDRGGAPSEVQSCPPQPASHPRARLQARARSPRSETGHGLCSESRGRGVSGAGSLRSGRGQAGRARTSGTRSASDAGGLARTGDAACPRGCQAPRAPCAPRRPGPRGPHGPSHRTRTAGRAERGGQGRRPPLEGTPAPGRGPTEHWWQSPPTGEETRAPQAKGLHQATPGGAAQWGPRSAPRPAAPAGPGV